MHHTHTTPHNDGGATTRGRVIRWARLYDPFVSMLTLGRRGRLRRTTLDLARLHAGDDVLEVGCGTGDLAIGAARLVGPAGSAYGTDASSAMIAMAQKKAAKAGIATTFLLAPIEALPFPDASFDVVLSSMMLHHLPDTLKPLGLAEVARVLRPGGRLLIVDFKRPVARSGRIANRLLLHGALREGVQDVAPLLPPHGFTVVQAGDTAFRPLGFVLALRGDR